jgi:hypothetical protein
MLKRITFFALLALLGTTLNAQNTGDDLEKLMQEAEAPATEYVRNAFKSNRVINGHSMEMVGKGVLDFRILHRFGLINGGWRDLFGLDQASMRFGFDYGVSKNLTLGFGRSTFNKEYDGYVKYRFTHQRKGEKSFPLSLLWVSGITLSSVKYPDPRLNDFSNRLGYYHQLIAGRKFGEHFTLQLSPTVVHRNMTELPIDRNDMVALGIGGRVRLSKRMAFILDTYPMLYGARPGHNFFPLSLGVDIETGGHVFQLHITNARGMNEKAFIAETLQDWGQGQIQFGFNLSRVFTVVRNTSSSF